MEVVHNIELAFGNVQCDKRVRGDSLHKVLRSVRHCKLVRKRAIQRNVESCQTDLSRAKI